MIDAPAEAVNLYFQFEPAVEALAMSELTLPISAISRVSGPLSLEAQMEHKERDHKGEAEVHRSNNEGRFCTGKSAPCTGNTTLLVL